MESGKSEQYKTLTQFKDLKDFNNNFEQWMVEFKEEFSKGELLALKRLVRFSASIQGVCYAKIQTIVAATHDHDGMGISRSTFKRMLNKASEFGLITIHHTFKSGKQGHSVYVFNRFVSDNMSELKSDISVQDEPPKEEILNQRNKTVIPSKTSNILTKRYNGELSSEFTSSKVPKDFIKLVSNFYNSAEIIEELWKCVTFSEHSKSFDSQSVLEIASDSFRQLIRQAKNGRVRKSVYALFWGILNAKFRVEWINNAFDSYMEA